MHILYVENAIGFGGSTRCALDLADRCIRHGWKATLALGFPLPAGQSLPPSVELLPLYELPAMRRAVKLRRFRTRSAWHARAGFAASTVVADFPLAVRLARYVIEHSVDVIHANNDLLVNRAAILAGSMTDCPVVSHQRGWVWPCGTVRRLARRADRLIAISQAVRESMVDAGVDRDRITVCYDGIDTARFSVVTGDRERVRREWGWTDDHLVVGMPAVLTAWKGHTHFLRSFAAFVDRVPVARAVLVGGGVPDEPNLLSELRGLTRQLDIQDRVHFAEHVVAMPAAYAAMDIVVHASVKPEPLGLVVLETMAAGRAVIAARAGGPAEIITDAVDGLLVSPGDRTALVDAMCRLASDAPLRSRLGRAGCLRASDFDLNNCWSRTVDTYQDVVGRARRLPRESTPWASRQSSCC